MAKSKGKRKVSEMIQVWYQLYGENGKPFKNYTPAMVSVDESYVVAELKDATYEKNKPILPEKFVASCLKVYERENQGSSSAGAPLENVDLNQQELLKEDRFVCGLGACEANSMIVVVPVYGINT